MTELLGEELWSTALSQPKDNNDDEDDLPSGEVNIHHFSPTLRGIIVLVYTTQVYFLQINDKKWREAKRKATLFCLEINSSC